MAIRSGTLIDAIPSAHRSRFVPAGSIRRSTGMPEALRQRNHDLSLQQQIQETIAQRIAAENIPVGLPADLIGHDKPGDPREGDVKAFYLGQQQKIESGNRFKDGEYTPLPRENMPPLTAKTRSFANGDPLFPDAQSFLNAFDWGLEYLRGNSGKLGAKPYATIGLFDVGGGAGTRAALELPKYPDYARQYGITSSTNRNLYSIYGAQGPDGRPRTFKGLLLEIVERYCESQDVILPVSEMILAASADQYVQQLRQAKHDTAKWGDEMLFWGQNELLRYDANDPELKALPDFFPAGHGDSPRLTYKYGLMQAMAEVGVKTVVGTNGDEFIWVLFLPALLAAANQRGTLDHFNFAAIVNTNGQLAGDFGNNEQVETPCVPASRVKVAPATLNSTFKFGGLGRVIRGFDLLSNRPRKIDLVGKPTNGYGKFYLQVASDSWMGAEFSRANKAAGGELNVMEISRNLFTGHKGSQHSGNHKPEEFLHGLGYADFYSLVAKNIHEWQETLLGHSGVQARYELAERMLKHDFDPILVALDEQGNLPESCSCGKRHK
jgi:hypothetical protein